MNPKNLVSLIGLVLIVFPFSIFAQDLKSARKLTYYEKYDEAKKVFDSLLRKEPSSENYYYQGENYIFEYLSDTISVSLKDLSESTLPVFKKGIEADSVNPLNYIGLGRVALLMDDKENANKYFKKAKSFLAPYKKIKKIKDPKRYGYVLAKLAESQIVRQHVDTAKALHLACQAQMVDPANPEIFIITGDIYLLVKDPFKAIKNYNKANDLDPKSPVAKVKIGNIYTRAQNLQEAIKYLVEAIIIDSSYIPAYSELDKLYILAGKKPKFPTIERVRILFKAKDYEECIKLAVDILKIDKSNNELRRIAAISYYEKRNPDYIKALWYMEEFFKYAKPDKIVIKDYIYHGCIILKNNQGFLRSSIDTMKLSNSYNLVLKEYENARDKNKKDSLKLKLESIQHKFIEVIKKIKEDSIEIDRGFERLNYAYSLDTTNIDLLLEIATNYYTFKRYKDAIRIYSNVLVREPSGANAYLNLGKSYYQLKNYSNATEIFKKLTEIAPDLVAGFSWLANSYSEFGKETKQEVLAIPYFIKLIEKANIDPVKYEQYLYDSWSYLYSYFYSSKDFDKDKCLNYANNMLSATPNKANRIKAYKLRAAVNEKSKDYTKAMEDYQEVLKLDPKDYDVKMRLEKLTKIK